MHSEYLFTFKFLKAFQTLKIKPKYYMYKRIFIMISNLKLVDITLFIFTYVEHV